MTAHEVAVLNSLVTYAAENIPGELGKAEREVAHIVGTWALDGVPVRQVCPHCNAPAPQGEGRVEFLKDHLGNSWHRWRWSLNNKLKF